MTHHVTLIQKSLGTAFTGETRHLAAKCLMGAGTPLRPYIGVSWWGVVVYARPYVVASMAVAVAVARLSVLPKRERDVSMTW